MLEASTDLGQRALDYFNAAARLDIGVTHADDLAILPNGRRTGDGDVGARTDRPAVANGLLPGSARRNSMAAIHRKYLN